MANNPFFSDEVVIATLNVATAKMNSGFIVIYTGTQPTDANQTLSGTLLAKLPLGTSAFGGASASGAAGSRNATANANAITSTSAIASGTAGYFAILKSDGITVAAMGSVGTTGADMNLNSLSITINQLVTISAGTITQPE